MLARTKVPTQEPSHPEASPPTTLAARKTTTSTLSMDVAFPRKVASHRIRKATRGIKLSAIAISWRKSPPDPTGKNGTIAWQPAMARINHQL